MFASFGSSVYSVLLFLIVVIIGLNVLTLTFCMSLNFLTTKFAVNRIVALIVMTICYFLIGILFCTEKGLRILQIWEYYAMGLGPALVICVEVFAMMWLNKDKLELVVPTHWWKTGRFVLAVIVYFAFFVILVSDCMNPLKLTKT